MLLVALELLPSSIEQDVFNGKSAFIKTLDGCNDLFMGGVSRAGSPAQSVEPFGKGRFVSDKFA